MDMTRPIKNLNFSVEIEDVSSVIFHLAESLSHAGHLHDFLFSLDIAPGF